MERICNQCGERFDAYTGREGQRKHHSGECPPCKGKVIRAIEYLGKHPQQCDRCLATMRIDDSYVLCCPCCGKREPYSIIVEVKGEYPQSEEGKHHAESNEGIVPSVTNAV